MKQANFYSVLWRNL